MCIICYCVFCSCTHIHVHVHVCTLCSYMYMYMYMCIRYMFVDSVCGAELQNVHLTCPASEWTLPQRVTRSAIEQSDSC